MLRHLRNHLSPPRTYVLLSSFGFTKAKPSFITPPTKENWIRSSHLQSRTWEVRKPNICPKKKKSKNGMSAVATCVPGTHPDAVPASSYDRSSSSPLTALDGVREPALHAVLGKSAKHCIQNSGFIRNYTAVVHRKDMFLSNCFP